MQNSSKQKELELKEKELALKEKELLLKEKGAQNKDSLIIKNSNAPSAKFTVNPLKEGGGPGQVSFSKNGNILFYFEQKSQKGKIVINGTKYILNKGNCSGNYTTGSYKLFGSGIVITALKCKVNEVGDCFHGKCPQVTITQNKNSITIDNVDYMDCLSFTEGD